MIVKVKSHKKPIFKNLLEYMLNDKARLFDKDGRGFLLTHNLTGNSIDSWVRQYKENEKYRNIKRSDSVYVKHEILSFHKGDSENISIGKLRDIARQYIKLRNPRGMYVAVCHTDKDHLHVHLCSSGIEYRSGKSMWMPRKDFSDLKKSIQDYQRTKYPELCHSIVEHGANREQTISDREYQYKKRTGRETDREKVLCMLKSCYQKAVSEEDFYVLLQDEGLKTYIRGGSVYGIWYGKRKYRFKTLGYSPEKLSELNLQRERSDDIQNIRENKEYEYNKKRDIGKSR